MSKILYNVFFIVLLNIAETPYNDHNDNIKKYMIVFEFDLIAKS